MKKLSWLAPLTLSSFLLLTLAPSLAKAETACGITPPTIILSEFSFNNTINDYIELTVLDDGNHGLGQIMTDYGITSIDATVKKIPNSTVKTGDKLRFSDIPNLTATTDQLVLTHLDEHIDAVCWTSTTPTDQEKADFAKLTSHGSWNGTIENCLSSTGLEKNSSFRRNSSSDTNSSADWSLLSATTIMQPPTPQPTTTTTSSAIVATNEIIVNEFLPDPEGSDDGNEWIELKNTSDHTVSLADWQIDDEDGGSKPYTIGNITIGAESFLLLKNDKTNITLNNSIDSVRLIDPTGTVYETVPYTKIAANQSWSRTTSSTWKLTKTLTPGEENVTEEPVPDTALIPDPTAPQATDSTTLPATDPPVVISEILPNPTGTDSRKEWIEIHNKTAADISLAGWRITNATGKTFLFPSDTIIPANEFITISDQESKISLKNSGDQITILNPLLQIQNEVTYEDAPENTSFSQIETIPMPETTPTAAQTTPPQTSFMNWLVPTAYAQNYDQSINDDEESTWEWTDIITKGSANPTYLKLEGTVQHELDNSGKFILKTAHGDFPISIDSKRTNPELIKSTLTLGSPLQIKVLKRDDSSLVLASYAVKNALASKKTSSTNAAKTMTIAMLILMIASAIAAKIYLKKNDSSFSTIFDHDPAV